MKKLYLSLLTVLLPLVAFADAVEIDGIYYILDSDAKTAEVTSNPQKYPGCVVIPASISFKSSDYKVTSIGEKAFYDCDKLTSLIMPDSLTSIGNLAFYNCKGINTITIPQSITSIGESAFAECYALSIVNITNIASWCSILFSDILSNPLFFSNTLFINGNEITDLIIPDSVNSIGNYAFEYCSGLTSVTFSDGLTSIGESAFSDCYALTSVTIPNSVTSIGERAFSWCTSLTSVTIPNGITSINAYTFLACRNLDSITIPNSVVSIRTAAFSGCEALTTITIGTEVKHILNEAFANCPKLIDVYCLSESVPETSSDAFQSSYYEYAVLHVPANSINAYKSTVPWKNFMSIVSLEGDTPETPKCATPIISYQNGQLIFESETEGVEFVSEITDTDIKKHYDAKVSLTATYNITVYATKTGYDNSDVATATLCWIDQQPRTEGITDGLAQIPACPVLIKTDRGRITVEGIDDQTNISLFTTDGKLAGSAISQNGSASIDTHLPSGTTAIIKIGEKSVKVLVK